MRKLNDVQKALIEQKLDAAHGARLSDLCNAVAQRCEKYPIREEADALGLEDTYAEQNAFKEVGPEAFQDRKYLAEFNAKRKERRLKSSKLRVQVPNEAAEIAEKWTLAIQAYLAEKYGGPKKDSLGVVLYYGVGANCLILNSYFKYSRARQFSGNRYQVFDSGVKG